jgi:hypothetical protein
MSQEKEELLELQTSGMYVFHGTHKELKQFIPQQAHNFGGKIQTKDGKPAVFASSFAEYAIFMAIITEENCPHGYWSGAGLGESLLTFKATEKTLEQLNESSSGWVYVFNKNDFTERDPEGFEYVSHTEVIPVTQIHVSKQDLPENIEMVAERNF